MRKPESIDLKIFISSRESTCEECHENLGKNAWITLNGDRGAFCLACADLDHLLFLPSGDAALTRRSKKYSTLWAVVLKWNRSAKRYQRQGLLVEEKALEQAEKECMEDSELRERRKERAAIRRTELDKKFVHEFATKIRQEFPKCPKGKEKIIAEHACLKYSGRVGRSASAKNFSDEAIRLAVIAHVRHLETEYDQLLMKGYDRQDARALVQGKIENILLVWTG